MAKATKARADSSDHVATDVGGIEDALAFYAHLYDFKLRGKRDDSAFIDPGDRFLALRNGRRQASNEGGHSGRVLDDNEAFSRLLA
jgi:hypothetical protein